jgi:hypothetical protein
MLNLWQLWQLLHECIAELLNLNEEPDDFILNI